MSRPAGWEHLLDEDERILWQGQPGLPEGTRPMRVMFPVVGAFFCLVALGALSFIWSAKGLPVVLTLFASLFLLPFLALGLFLIFFAARFTRRLAARTHYTLTTRRAFIASTLFGRRRLTTLPLRRDSLALLEGEGGRGSILFRPGPKKGQNSSLSQGLESGFLNIPEAAHVHALAIAALEKRA